MPRRRRTRTRMRSAERDGAEPAAETAYAAQVSNRGPEPRVNGAVIQPQVQPVVKPDGERVAAAVEISSGATEPALADPKYTALIDDKHIYGFQNVAPIVSKKLVAAYGAKFTNAVNAVSAKLTNKAMIAMNKAVAVDKKTPAAVAAAYLKANGLA